MNRFEYTRPTNVAGATPEVEKFLDEATESGHLEFGPGFRALSADLYRLYVVHAEAKGAVPMTKNLFGRVLTAVGAPQVRGTGNIMHRGGVKILYTFPAS